VKILSEKFVEMMKKFENEERLISELCDLEFTNYRVKTSRL